MEKRPNIILVLPTSSAVILWALACMVRSPNLDALARKVHFANAFVQNTVTVPSQACLQTGRYTHQHGVTYMGRWSTIPGPAFTRKPYGNAAGKLGYWATGKIHMYPAKGFDWQQLCGEAITLAAG